MVIDDERAMEGRERFQAHTATQRGGQPHEETKDEMLARLWRKLRDNPEAWEAVAKAIGEGKEIPNDVE